MEHSNAFIGLLIINKMRKIFEEDINTQEYWDNYQWDSTPLNFGLRQIKYAELAGSGNRIVEIACGLSPFIAEVQSFNERYGVDFSPKTLKKASERYPNVKYILADCKKTLPFEDKFFDVSVAGEIIEHLRNPEILIKEMARITKRRMIISTPHMEYDDKEHLWEFDESDLIRIFSPYGKSQCETIHSEWFPGRSYIFAWCDLA